VDVLVLQNLYTTTIPVSWGHEATATLKNQHKGFHRFPQQIRALLNPCLTYAPRWIKNEHKERWRWATQKNPQACPKMRVETRVHQPQLLQVSWRGQTKYHNLRDDVKIKNQQLDKLSGLITIEVNSCEPRPPWGPLGWKETSRRMTWWDELQSPLTRAKLPKPTK
jgi:hypothetical protein